MARIHTHIGSAWFTVARTSALVGLAAFVMSAAAVLPSTVTQPPPQKPTPPVPQVPPGPVVDPTPFCFGDGVQVPCPCDNNGMRFQGCENSALTGGAALGMMGVPQLSNDTVHLTVFGELPTSLSIVLQGSAATKPMAFGDGLRCVGGSILRLYVLNAVGGMINVPQPGNVSISERALALGDTLTSGSQRVYQVLYNDSGSTGCSGIKGERYNLSNGMLITWVK